jgi:hypothetical protein
VVDTKGGRRYLRAASPTALREDRLAINLHVEGVVIGRIVHIWAKVDGVELEDGVSGSDTNLLRD